MPRTAYRWASTGLVLLVGAFLLIYTVEAQAAYWAGPAAPPAHTCATTAATDAAWQTNVNTGAAGIHCRSNGTAATLVTFNRTATGIAVAASVSGYGVIRTGGVQINGAGNVTLQGLDISNPGSGNVGDCVRIAAAAANVLTQYSKIHNCYRNGLSTAAPACCPGVGYAQNIDAYDNFVSDLGNTDTSGSAFVLKVQGTAPSMLARNDVGPDLPNDGVLGWGPNIQIVQSKWHNFTPVGANHPDVFQTWKLSPTDPAEGLPVTGLLIERNRVYNNTDPNGHLLFASGNAGSGWTIRSNETCGLAGHLLGVGDPTVVGNPTGVNVLNNTFYGGLSLDFANGATGAITSNIFENVSTGPYTVGTGAVTRDYNDAHGGALISGEVHGQNLDPSFVNTLPVCGNKDLHLGAASPLVDDGSPTSPGGTDIDSGARLVGAATDPGSDER